MNCLKKILKNNFEKKTIYDSTLDSNLDSKNLLLNIRDTNKESIIIDFYEKYIIEKNNMENNLFEELLLSNRLTNFIDLIKINKDSHGIYIKLLSKNKSISIRYILIEYISFNLEGIAKIGPCITLLKDKNNLDNSIIYNTFCGYPKNIIKIFYRLNTLINEIIRILDSIESLNYIEDDIIDNNDFNNYIEYIVEDCFLYNIV
jgi:hypothetical protein